RSDELRGESTPPNARVPRAKRAVGSRRPSHRRRPGGAPAESAEHAGPTPYADRPRAESALRRLLANHLRLISDLLVHPAAVTTDPSRSRNDSQGRKAPALRPPGRSGPRR